MRPSLYIAKEQAIEEELDNRAGLAICYGNQALILKARGQLDEALALHHKEQAIKEELGNREGLAICYWNLAHLLLQMGDQEEARELAHQAVAIRRDIGIPTDDMEAGLDQFDPSQ